MTSRGCCGCFLGWFSSARGQQELRAESSANFLLLVRRPRFWWIYFRSTSIVSAEKRVLLGGVAAVVFFFDLVTGSLFFRRVSGGHWSLTVLEACGAALSRFVPHV